MTEDVHLQNFYNLLMSQLLQFLLQLHDGDENIGCCKRILELIGETAVDISWTDYKRTYDLVDQVCTELKNILLTIIARNTDYSIHTCMKEAKKFMTCEDYIDTIERSVYYRNGGPKAFYDICSCNRCYQ